MNDNKQAMVVVKRRSRGTDDIIAEMERDEQESRRRRILDRMNPECRKS